MEFIDALWNHPQHNSFKPHHIYDNHRHSNNNIYKQSNPYPPEHAQEPSGQHGFKLVDIGTSNGVLTRLASTSSEGYASADNSPVKKNASDSLNPTEGYQNRMVNPENGRRNSVKNGSPTGGGTINPSFVTNHPSFVQGLRESSFTPNFSPEGSIHDVYGEGKVRENLSAYKHARSDSGVGAEDDNCFNSNLPFFPPQHNNYSRNRSKGQMSEERSDVNNRSPMENDDQDRNALHWDVISNNGNSVHMPPLSDHLNDIATQVLNENNQISEAVSNGHGEGVLSQNFSGTPANRRLVHEEENLSSNCSTIMDMLSIDNSDHNNQGPQSAIPKFAQYPSHKDDLTPNDPGKQTLKGGSLVDDDLLLYDEDINLSTSDLYLKSQGPSMSNMSLNSITAPYFNHSELGDMQTNEDSPPNMANPSITASNKSLAEYIALFQDLSGNTGATQTAPYNDQNTMVSQYNNPNAIGIMCPILPNNFPLNIGTNHDANSLKTDQGLKTYDPLLSSACSIGMRTDSFDNLIQNTGMDLTRSFSVSNVNGRQFGGHSNSLANNNFVSSLPHSGGPNCGYHLNDSMNSIGTSQSNSQSIPQLLNDLITGNGKILVGSTSSLSSLSSVSSSVSVAKKEWASKGRNNDSIAPPTKRNFNNNSNNSHQPIESNPGLPLNYPYSEPMGTPVGHQPYAPLGPRSYPTRLENNGSIIKSLLRPETNKDASNALHRAPVDPKNHSSPHENGGFKAANDVTSTTDLVPPPYYYQLNSHYPYMLPPNLKRYSQPIISHYNNTTLPPFHKIPMTSGGSSAGGNCSGQRGCDTRRASDSVVDTTEMLHQNHGHNTHNLPFNKNAINLPFSNHLYTGEHKNHPNSKYINAIRLGSFTARSRDQRRAEALNIPFNIDEIIYSPIDEFTDILRKHNLTDAQISLIRDIRRRGKNKVAAQNCRKRKIDGIMTLEQSVEYLKAIKGDLLHERTILEKDLHEQHHKYDGIYTKIFTSLRDENGTPYSPNEYMLQFSGDGNLFLIPKNHSSVTSNLSSPMMMKLCDNS